MAGTAAGRMAAAGLVRCLSLFFCALCCLLAAGCSDEQGFIDFSRRAETPAVQEGAAKPLVIAFAPVMSPEETRQSYQRMVEYIAEEIGRPTAIVQKRSTGELNRLVAAGEADIAFLSTGAYTAYRGQEPIELLAMVETGGTVLYRTFLIVAADSPIMHRQEVKTSMAYLWP